MIIEKFQAGDKVYKLGQYGEQIHIVITGPFTSELHTQSRYVVQGTEGLEYVCNESTLTLVPITWTPRVKGQLDAWLREAVSGDNGDSWQEHFQYLSRKISSIKVAP